jgi:uroporphyrinogen-III synthase
LNAKERLFRLYSEAIIGIEAQVQFNSNDSATLMTKPLAGINVLITRPVGQAQELMTLIEAGGGKACHQPVMEIAALDEVKHAPLLQLSKQIVLALDQYQHVIFISTNAVEHGLELIDQYWPQLPIDIQWYAIGKATAAALLQQQIVTAVQPSDAMNSEALLQHASLQQIAGDKIAIVRGVGGRDYLREQLQQRGAIVNYIECYQRLVPQSVVSENVAERLADRIEQQSINVVCINSIESIDNFLALLANEVDAAIKKLALVVPSKRVADHAEQQGFNHILIAANASNQAITKTLEMISER